MSFVKTTQITPVTRNEIEYDAAEIKHIHFGNIIHTIKLEDQAALSNGRKEHNCKMALHVTKGKSLDKRYDWYPYWSMGIIDRQGNPRTITPTKNVFISLIKEFFLHEARVDATRNRRSDIPEYKKKLNEIVFAVQKQLTDYQIPEVYMYQQRNNNF